jgi:hypothetical protein
VTVKFIGGGNQSTRRYQPTCRHWPTISHNVVSSTTRHEHDLNAQRWWWYALNPTTIRPWRPLLPLLVSSNISDFHISQGPGWLNELGRWINLTIHTSLSPIRCGIAPGIVNYKKKCTWLAAASDKVYQLLAHGRWFSPGTPTSFTTKTGRHDIAEILLKVALKHQKWNQKIIFLILHISGCSAYNSYAHLIF